MEFSSSDWPGFSDLYEAWASKVIPRIGKAVARDEDSYRYLVESIRRFPRPPAFKATTAGFVRAAAEPMLGGLVTIHSGWEDLTTSVTHLWTVCWEVGPLRSPICGVC